MLGRYAYARVAHPNKGVAARRTYTDLYAAVFTVVFYSVITKVVNHFKYQGFSAVYKGAVTLCRYGYSRLFRYARYALYSIVCDLQYIGYFRLFCILGTLVKLLKPYNIVHKGKQARSLAVNITAEALNILGLYNSVHKHIGYSAN